MRKVPGNLKPLKPSSQGARLNAEKNRDHNAFDLENLFMKKQGYLALICLLSGVMFLGCAETPAPEGTSQTSLPKEQIASSQEHDWPSDIDPDSRSRLPLKSREDLDEEGQEVYDFLVDPESETLAGLTGPRGFYLYSPKAGRHLSQANSYLRFESGLDFQVRELAILVVAQEMQSQFEWTMHEPVAREVGLDPAAIDVVKFNKNPQDLQARDALVIRFGRELMRESRLSSETYNQVAQEFGEEGLVTLTFLMGNYVRSALMLRAADMRIPLDREPLLPLTE
jgi:4-carboxymuconolactone decarboxylase